MSSSTFNYYAITGIKEGKGPNLNEVPLRQDIDTWSGNPANKTQVDLYLLALKRFQEVDPQDKLSYYQVAGIHGLPSIPWDEDSNTPVNGQGYCTHNSNLFLPWHRPYMLLFEQRIYESMIEVIKEYESSEHASLKATAQKWRLPYWDFARKNDIPDLCKQKTVDVRGPKGTLRIDNPLYRFTLPNLNKYHDFGNLPGRLAIRQSNNHPYGVCKSTIRWPEEYNENDPKSVQEWQNGVQDDNRKHEVIVKSMEAQRPPYREMVVRLFDLDNWKEFSTTAAESTDATGESLEQIHNDIHGHVGGDRGHMGNAPVAGFDPIFWLHHCNIDRLFAIWQAIHPNSWFNNRDQQIPEERANIFLVQNEIATPKTKLRPFHKDGNGGLYNSDDIRDTVKLGYAYPELQKWKFKDDSSYIASIYNAINQLYPSPSREALLQHPQFELKLPAPVRGLFTTAIGIASTISRAIGISFPDFVVRVLYSRFDLGGLPYRIYIFFGSEDETINTHPSTWLTSPYLVSTVYNFSSLPENLETGQEGCGNCRAQQDARILSVGQIPLVEHLIKAIDNPHIPLNSFGPDAVQGFIRSNLRWAVTGHDGKVVPLSNLPSLKFSVFSGVAEHFRDPLHLSHFSKYEELLTF